MADPRLLMLDEPSMGLAPKIVDNILDALQQVTGRGTSILLAEQNTALALDVTDRSYVLVSGEIVASGAGNEVGQDLLERYLASVDPRHLRAVHPPGVLRLGAGRG